MRIERAARFDDVDPDLGYEYRGFNYVIRSEMNEFHIRTYDDELGKATVVWPTSMPASRSLRMLVEFLQVELSVSSIFLYNSEVGNYAEIDLHSLRFKK